MPDSRRHRGPHPQDVELFAATCQGRLREAVRDLSWLLTRGYAERSALKLVGDRFALLERQRTAVLRSACSEDARSSRIDRQLPAAALVGQTLAIDGFNLLTTVEAALSGGVLLLGQDGCLRDMASMHGSYRRVAETIPALVLIGEFVKRLGVKHCRWWLDQPVSNSARLRTSMQTLAAEHNWLWDVELLPDPDAELRRCSDVVATADAGILDDCDRWFNLACEVVKTRISDVELVDLRD